jgi:23S rRNA pseudouridine1911/1915/1917 synthase
LHTTPVVLYEDNHLLVIDKPAGLTTQGASDGEPSVVTWAKEYLRRKYAKPGNVYLGVVSRLDALVSGVLVLARTSKGAARLSEQFRTGTPVKRYWALVEDKPHPPAGTLEHCLVKDERQQRMVAVDGSRPGGQTARLRYRTLASVPPLGTVLEIVLETGRKHQIRVQLATSGWPILGDAKYGARTHFPGGIALHARSLTFTHPVRQEALTFVSPLPRSWHQAGIPAPLASTWDSP